MKWSQIFFPGKLIERRLVKKKAHAFTLLTILWFLFSVLAFIACRTSSQVSTWVIASAVWLAPLAFIGFALWFAVHEKKNSEILVYAHPPE